MEPKPIKSTDVLNIIIYAQSGFLAGDLGALLSGYHQVDLQTSISAVVEAISPDSDVVLLISGVASGNSESPDEIIDAVSHVGGRVILLGQWPLSYQNSAKPWIVRLKDIPAPGELFRIIAE